MFIEILRKIWEFLTKSLLKFTFPWSYAELQANMGKGLIAYAIGTVFPIAILWLIFQVLILPWGDWIGGTTIQLNHLIDAIAHVLPIAKSVTIAMHKAVSSIGLSLIQAVVSVLRFVSGVKIDLLTATVVVSLISFLTGFGALIWFMVKKIHEAGLTVSEALSLNLDSMGGGWKGLLKAMLAAVPYYLVAYAAEPPITAWTKAVFHLKDVTDPAMQIGMMLSGPLAIVFYVFISVAAPLGEEPTFRGGVFNSMRKSFRDLLKNDVLANIVAAVLSGAVFAAAHFAPSGFFVLWFMGILLAMCYLRTGTLYSPMFLHFLINATAAIQMAKEHFHW